MDSYCDRCGKKHNQEIERERSKKSYTECGYCKATRVCTVVPSMAQNYVDAYKRITQLPAKVKVLEAAENNSVYGVVMGGERNFANGNYGVYAGGQRNFVKIKNIDE